MKLFIKTLFLLALAVLFSCEEQGLFVNCTDCEIEEPINTKLEIKLDKAVFGLSTAINIYEGNIEDSVIYGSTFTYYSDTNFTVSINKHYTVTATYKINNKQYVAVDEATPRVKYTKDDCDDPCYFVYDKVVNLKLK
jgi:hypothetical protein